jgi:hypothetical protein
VKTRAKISEPPVLDLENAYKLMEKLKEEARQAEADPDY